MNLGLLGSGEFTPAAIEIDSAMLEGSRGSGKVLIAPTASAPEGDDVFKMWIAKGIDHYTSLGAEPVPLYLRRREDASDSAILTALEDASLIFFSGGNPGYLAMTLQGTEFWSVLVQHLGEGLAFGGCSAGSVALGSRAPDTSTQLEIFWVDGLKLLPRLFIGAHWDRLDDYEQGLKSKILRHRPEGTSLMGIDELTGVIGDGQSWRVLGEGGVEVATTSEDQRILRNGESFELLGF